VENPAVTKESVHHFFKYVSGSILTRPPWFMDVTQEGEGIVDVTTHLVDLIQWECFPEQIIDYKKDIQFFSARRWPTDMSVSQFNAVTKLNGFPDYLKKNVVKDSILKIFSNGEINYQLKGIHAKVSVTWAYKAPEGAGDTHYSIMRGTKSNLVIRQGAEQKYKPSLYIEPVNKQDASFQNILIKNFTSLQTQFPGLELKKTKSGWEVVIPEKYREGHEAHFARVTEKFLQYLKEGKLPAWEVPNMIAKYYTTTTALEFAKRTAGAIQ
nr:oxidoreductase [Chitinophagaceae bacterium]